jgi:hypothetical protein
MSVDEFQGRWSNSADDLCCQAMLVQMASGTNEQGVCEIHIANGGGTNTVDSEIQHLRVKGPREACRPHVKVSRLLLPLSRLLLPLLYLARAAISKFCPCCSPNRAMFQGQIKLMKARLGQCTLQRIASLCMARMALRSAI